MKPPSISEIINLIHTLNLKKSAGDDEISTYILRISAETISPLLYHLFMYIYEFGVFPSCFKTAKVSPIFKTGNKTEKTNYSPISLLSCISKVLEKTIKKRLSKFFEKHKVICENQFGFRKNHTTKHVLLKVITQCFDNAKDKYHSCLIMLDIRKAFDTVNHELLLSKLYHYGIRGITYKLIQSYLNNRSQFVNINNKFSKKLIIKHGVPQGSNLGPLLFLIYINDLPNALSCHTTLFADDTCLLIQAKNVSNLQKRSHNELSKVQQWMNCNKLTLNPNKTQVLLIPSSRQQVISTTKLYLNNELIKPIETAKYLGITLDSQLKFDIFISKLLTKISRSIGVMSKIRHYLPKTVLLDLYFALIHTQLLYRIAV